VEQAFANVELALKDAGGKGWSQVFRISLFTTDMSEACLGAMKASMEKWMPDHKPVVTGVGVAALAIPGMTVEVEVWAHDPRGSQSEA
jgi:enamine deaminase RidA (YjgF/YER057c/UK114 family)